MKHLIVITAMLISIAASGQETDKQNPTSEFKRLLFGVNFSPDICYNTSYSDDSSPIIIIILDNRRNTEVPKFGFTAGVNAYYSFSRHLGVEVGVQYSNKGYAQKKIDLGELIFGDQIDSQDGFIYQTKESFIPTSIKFRYNYKYLDIPVRAIFSFGKKKIRFVTSIGVTTNILVKATNKSIMKDEDGETKRETSKPYGDFESLNISPTFSTGVDFNISKKLTMKVEPTFRYGLLKIIDAPITTYLWGGGLNVSCYYGVK